MITSENRLLTAREIAQALSVHVNTMKRIPSCDLPYTRVGSRGDRRYHPEDVQSYIDRRTVK